MMKKILVGISSCLMGQNVRYDGANKRLDFAVDELANYLDFEMICPEVALGLGVPRQTIQLVQQSHRIMLRFTEDNGEDLTLRMEAFATQKVTSLNHLCGYIVCAKSPSCGMGSTKIYNFETNSIERNGTGLFTKALLREMPWLPVEENSCLDDKNNKANFIERVYALHELNSLQETGLTRAKLIKFHSRYKYTLLAHSQPKYRELGLFVANIAKWESLIDYFIAYRQHFMALLACQPTVANHTNTLMHIQGYFKKKLNTQQKQQLTVLITDYKQGLVPLSAPINLLKEFLIQYPDDYLSQQRYFNPYPEALRLKYGY